jgi:hypothetical protein
VEPLHERHDEGVHPQLEPAPGAWHLIVSDGPDFIVGPYDTEADAWETHDRMDPPPCLAYQSPPTQHADMQCYCVARQGIREKAAA